jgi:hypothetical protein
MFSALQQVVSCFTDNTSRPQWATVWHALSGMGTPHYEFKQFYFIFMHSSSSDSFQLIALILMQIPCWLIGGAEYWVGGGEVNRTGELKLWPSCMNSSDHTVLSPFKRIQKPSVYIIFLCSIHTISPSMTIFYKIWFKQKVWHLIQLVLCCIFWKHLETVL